MDKLKLYAAPIVALALLLVWLLVIRPMLEEAEQVEDADGTATGQRDGEAGAAKQGEGSAQPR